MHLQRIEIKPSARLAAVLCVAHLAAAVCISFAALPLWLKSGAAIVIGAGLGWSLYSRAALRAAESVVALEITVSGRFSFLTRRGTWRDCELLGTSYVSPSLTILNLKPAGSRLTRHVVLVPDNVDTDDFRRLRTWLRWAPRDRASDANGASMSPP